MVRMRLLRPVLFFCAVVLLAEQATGSAIKNEESSLREKRRAESEDEVSWTSKAKGYYQKGVTFQKAVEKLPPKLKKAFVTGDFSDVNQQDLREIDISVVELIPREVIQKMNLTLVTTLIDMLVDKERPTGLSRIVDYAGEKLSPAFLLDKIKGNDMDENDETKRTLLYMAMEKLSDGGLVDSDTIRNLRSKGLLESVLPSQLVGVKDHMIARTILENLFGQEVREGKVRHNELEEKALLTKLVETAYGPTKEWTSQNLANLSKQVPSLASQFIKDVPDKAVADAMNHIKESDVRNPQLGMTLARKYLENHHDHESINKIFPIDVNGMMTNLGQIGAFLPMDMVRAMKDETRLVALADMTTRLEGMQQAVPVEVRKELINLKLDGKPLEQLNMEYGKDLGASLLSITAPSLINKIKDWNIFDTSKLTDIAQFGNDVLGQGLISQVAPWAIEKFMQRGSRKKVDLAGIPAPYLGSIPLETMKELDGNDVNRAVNNLRLAPNKLSEPIKGMLMGMLRDSRLLESVASHLPPQMRALLPTSSIPEHNAGSFLRGLPSSSPQKMHFALEELQRFGGRNLTAKDLEDQPNLLSVLTPEDISRFNPEHIPGLMLAIKNAKEGPSTQVLWALKSHLDAYLREKGSSPDATEKQLLKQMSQAEFINIPGSVLALFDKGALTASNIASDKKREILTSLGDLRKTDYLEVPRAQREAIIDEGLKALEAYGKAHEVGVEKLTAMGNAVQDLPASAIRQLTPVALEQVLPVLQGTNDGEDDDDQPQNGRLRIKACLKPDQRSALEARILEVFGPAKWWDGSTMAFLCCSLDVLSSSTLGEIRRDVILDCHCISDQEPPSHLKELKDAAQVNCGRELGVLDQLEKDFAKVEEKRAAAAMAIADQIVLSKRRRKRSNSGQLTCEAVRLATSGATFSSSQLKTMDPEEVSLCLYELGKKKLCEKRSSIIWHKLVEFYKGKVEEIPVGVLRHVGWVARGVDPTHALSLPLDNLDVLTAFGQDHMLSQEQLNALAVRVERVKGPPGVDYNTETLIYLNNILCGFNKEQITRIKPDYFLNASPVLRNLRSCKHEVLAGFAILAKGMDAFGPPQQWTAAEVRALGTVFAGVTQADLEVIRPRAIRGITPSAVVNMPPEVFRELSSEQIKNFPREAAQVVSESHLNQLKSEDRQVIPRLAGGMNTVSAAGASIASWSLISLSLILTAVTRTSLLVR